MDVPRDAATYLHRVGRAGRFGAAALTCTIACEGNELTELRSIITKTKANVRLIDPETLKPKNEELENKEGFTIGDLYEMWETLPQLEGTGLEGEGTSDSLLSNIEHEYQPNLQDTAKALLGKGRKKKSQNQKKKDTQKHEPKHEKTEENYVPIREKNDHDVRKLPEEDANKTEEANLENRLASMHIQDVEADRLYRQKWWDWYRTSMAYVARNKAYIQQREYIRFMTDM